MTSIYVQIGVAVILTFGIFGLLRLFFPSKAQEAELSLEKGIEANIQVAELLRHLATFAGTAFLGGLISYLIFDMLSGIRFSGITAHSDVLVTVDQIPKLFLSVIGGAGFGLLFSNHLLRYQLEELYESYLFSQNEVGKIDLSKASRMLGGIAIFCWFALTILFLNWYTIIGNNGIYYNGLFEVSEQFYTFDEILELEERNSFTLPDGSSKDLRYFVAVFENGDNWNSRLSGFGNPSANAGLFDLISKRSGVPIKTISK